MNFKDVLEAGQKAGFKLVREVYANHYRTLRADYTLTIAMKEVGKFREWLKARRIKRDDTIHTALNKLVLVKDLNESTK